MRQVGDRLIPVGVTSGRIHPLNGESIIIANGDPGVENSNENEGRSRRSRRRHHQQQPQDINQFLGTVGLGGQDLEEVRSSINSNDGYNSNSLGLILVSFLQTAYGYGSNENIITRA